MAACGSASTPGPDATPSDAAVAEAGDDAGLDAAAPMPDAAVRDAARADAYDPYHDPDARSAPTAITAPNEQWTWVPFSDAVCGNGSPTGIGVNLTDRSRRVLIFMMGGGACWNSLTCYTVGSAANFQTGYGEAAFRADFGRGGPLSLFDRTNQNNPFRDYSFVFVPYCTGDAHTGSNVTTFAVGGMARATYFVGHRNMEVFLRRLAPTFAGAERVVLSGSSAGGFGAGLNWVQTQTAFGSTRVDVLDDCGPPINSARWPEWRRAWNIQLPADCAECGTRADAIVEYYGQRYGATHRFALLAYMQDRVISQFMALTGPQVEEQLLGLRPRFDAIAGMRQFYLSGDNHVMLGNAFALATPSGTNLGDWLRQFATDDAAWRSVGPQ